MSFGDGAGWGGDTSFATETSGKVNLQITISLFKRYFHSLKMAHSLQDSESKNVGDKLPIPVQISLLASLTDDKIVFGNMIFSTVRIIFLYFLIYIFLPQACTIGDLKEVTVNQNKTFKMADPKDPNSTFTVTAFDGIVSILISPAFV